MDWQRILYEKTDDIVKITMNRPEVHNAADHLMLEELAEAFEEADRDEEIKVIILAGEGKSFSSGHDPGMSGKTMEAKGIEMQTKLTGPEARFKQEEYIFYKQSLTMRNVSKPTIAMVHGYCIDGGMVLACMCDLIIASEDSVFSNSILKIAAASVETLCEPWEIGPRKAKEYLWTGNRWDGREAERLGMINRCVPREKLEDETWNMARQIATMPPVVVSTTKRAINFMLDRMGQRDSWEYHFAIHQYQHSTDEYKTLREQRERSGNLKIKKTH